MMLRSLLARTPDRILQWGCNALMLWWLGMVLLICIGLPLTLGLILVLH